MGYRRCGAPMKLSFLILAAFVVPLISACSQMLRPSDAEMEAKFRTHRADFESLVKAIFEEQQISRVSIDNPSSKPDKIQENTNPNRADKIIATMRRLGVSKYEGSSRENALSRSVDFNMYTSGLGVSGSSKSLVYSEKNPPEAGAILVADTDKAIDEANHNRVSKVVYKSIDTNWYIRASN
jgi:hypothetical protein